MASATTTFRNSDTNSDIPIRTEKEKFDKYNNKTVQLHKNVLQVKNEFEYDKKIPLSPDTAKAKRNLEMDKEKKGKDLNDTRRRRPEEASVSGATEQQRQRPHALFEGCVLACAGEKR